MPNNRDTRDRILDTARRLFHQQGYTAVGVADICREASVVKGSFYHFYKSKDELLDAVINRNWEVTSNALNRLISGEGSGREKLARFFAMIVEHSRHMKTHDGRVYGCNIGVIASELGPATPDRHAVLSRVFSEWLAALTELVRQGQDDGSIDRRVSANELASALLASIQGMSVIGRTFDDPDMLGHAANIALKQIPPTASNTESL